MALLHTLLLALLAVGLSSCNLAAPDQGYYRTDGSYAAPSTGLIISIVPATVYPIMPVVTVSPGTTPPPSPPVSEDEPPATKH